MTALSIQAPFPTIPDIDGQPLEDGYIWIGVANLAPITNPITVYWDAALTIPAAQPVRTLGGYPMRSGTPARLYVNSDYSILVQNKTGSTVYSAPSATERYGNLPISSADVTFLQSGAGAVLRSVQGRLRDMVSVFDFMTAAQIADVQANTASVNVTAAIQQAINSTEYADIYFPPGTYLCTDSLYSYKGKGFIGDNLNNTVLLFDASTSTDGLVLGFRNQFANQAAFLAALPTLIDGWYLIGTVDLRFVRNFAQTATAVRQISPVTGNSGFRVENLRLSGVSTTKVRDLLVCDNAYQVTINDVWSYTAGGRGFSFAQCLHVSTRGIRSDDTVSHGVDLTGGDTTSVVMIGGYHRTTHSGAGIKSDCLGLTLDGPILEGIGIGSGVDVYVPGIWITGGTTTINQPYFEAVRGHNIFCQGGVVSVVNGEYNSGQGALNARYASLVVTGTAKVNVAGAAYSPGGGNKHDIFVSKDATTNNVWLTGSGPGDFAVMATNIANPLNYTECTYDVADLAALAAIVGMVLNQTAHVRSAIGSQPRDYIYNGASWVLVSQQEFNGGYLTRIPTDGTWRLFGGLLAPKAGNSPSSIAYMRSVTFDAAVGGDNVPAMQSGAVVNAHTAATATKSLGFTIPNYALGITAKNFQARFNTPLVPAGIVCRVNILNDTSVEIVVLNTTAGNLTLNATIQGQVVIEQWVQDLI